DPAFDIGERADAVPLELESPGGIGGRDPGSQLGHHRLDALGHRLPLWVLRRIHAMDHPVVASGAEQHVTALQALAVEVDHHLTVAPLDRLIGAFVPDQYLSAAVLAL